MSMKIILAFRYTGEDPAELKVTMGAIASSLRSLGHEVYCSIEDDDDFKSEKKSNKDIMLHTYAMCDWADMLFAFIRSNEKSEGMLMEIGYMHGKGKPVALARKRGVYTTSIHEMAEPFIEFDEVEDLLESISRTFTS